jgi:hypothetical protein
LATAVGGTSDLGRYLPIKVYVESGSFSEITYLSWTDPISGTNRTIYFDRVHELAYVIGLYWHPVYGRSTAVIPMKYWNDGPEVFFYPLSTEMGVNEDAICMAVRKSGLSPTPRIHIFLVLDRYYYRCETMIDVPNANIGWTLVSSGTTVPLYPSPRRYYSVTVTSGSNRAIIYLSYWYAINTDPGAFAVKVG